VARGLKRGSATARLLGLLVRIPSECFMCCQVEVSATGRLLVQRSPTECGVSRAVKKYIDSPIFNAAMTSLRNKSTFFNHGNGRFTHNTGHFVRKMTFTDKDLPSVHSE